MEQTTLTTRSFAQLRGVDEKTRRVDFVFSTSSKDRHGTIIPVENWVLENYQANPVVFYAHEGYGSDPDALIGRTVDIWREGENLMGRIEFEGATNNPLAEKVFRKVVGGFLNGASVGFRELTEGAWDIASEPGETDTYIFGLVELLEVSIVAIPSNAGALKRAFVDQVRKARPVRCTAEESFLLTIAAERNRKMREEKYLANPALWQPITPRR
jgi:HK97 family phage prohead protease